MGINECKGGDQLGQYTFFEEKVLPHSEAIFGCAWNRTRNLQDAEDITQEVLLRALEHSAQIENLSRENGGTSTKPWLMRVTNNLCTDGTRKKEGQNIPSSLLENENEFSPVDRVETSNPRELPEQAAEQSELGRKLREAIATLSPQKRFVALGRLAGLQYNEISKLSENTDHPMAEGTAKSNFNRGRKRLRRELGRRDIGSHGFNTP